MIFKLFRKNPGRNAVNAVYSAIVAQSRQPRFYGDWGVPDTVTGRFDMISLHLALLFRRLRHESGQAEFAQAVLDHFLHDMDRSLREMGVGDLSVPKKVKQMTTIFYGLLASVGEALDRNDLPGLEAVLRRNVLGETSTHAPDLASYLAAEAGRLAAMPAAAIATGQLQVAA